MSSALSGAPSMPGGDSPRWCAWCGSPFDNRSEPLAGRLRCAACGVATTDPWPDEHTLTRAYEGWYRPAEGRFAGPGDRLLRHTRGSLARRLDRIAPPGPVLDVGAGDGALLDALHARGREAIGLERASTRVDVMSVALDEVPGSFAAIVFWHSLEHLPAPGDALAQAATMLAAGGSMIVAVPNAASLQAQVFGDEWLALDLPRHLVHVPAPALLTTLEALGLRIERISQVRGGQAVFGWLHGLVARLPGSLNLYDAIRRPAAQSYRIGGAGRAATIAAGVALLPLAAALAALEAVLRRGGTVYVEARRPV